MASGSALTLDVLATWPIPDYVNPVSQQTYIEAALLTTTIMMILFVTARVYVRLNQKSGMGADDWVMVTAGVISIALTVILLILARYAVGRHLYDVRTEYLIPFAKMNLASLTLYNFSITLAKVSVCMTYLRLFPSRTNKIFSWTLIVYQTLWCVITSVLYIIQCIPIQAIWDTSITDKICLDSHKLLIASAALGIMSDFLIFLWPVMPLWQVKLPLLQRVHLVAVFSFGVFTCVAGMLKAIWAQEYFRTWDVTWVAGKVSIVVSMEVNVGIMSGCLPCLRPLLAMIFPAHFAASSAGRSDHPSGRGGSSWHKTPFSKRSANSIKLGSDERSEYAETYEFTNTKSEGMKVEAVHQDDVITENGIRVVKDVKIQHGHPTVGRATHDATSEEWIMRDDP